MKIIIDNQIPGLDVLLAQYGEVTSLPSQDITNSALQNADALFVRAVTPVDGNLLSHTGVKFVASATAGIDHLDLVYLKRQKIHSCYAPGSNSLAVMNYLMSSIAAIGFNVANKKIGVVGIGHIGKLVSNTLSRLGAQVFQKFRADNLLSSLPDDCDLVTLHPSLTFDHHPSYHLIDEKFLNRLKPGAILINASRGPVIKESALTRDDLIYCFDVWENEPEINLETYKKTTIATPHIAGYSFAAKYRVSLMVFDAFCDWQRLPKMTPKREMIEARIAQNQINLTLDENWQTNILKIYDPRKDRFDPAHFTQARKDYVLRPEILL